MQRTDKAREAINNKQKSPYAVTEVARAVALEQPSYLNDETTWYESTREIIKRCVHLIEK
jgi:hypothetical protein